MSDFCPAIQYLQCRHIKTNGLRCKSPVLGGTPFCYFHTRLQRPESSGLNPLMEDFKLPLLEDRSSIQLALTQILGALLSTRIDARRAGLCLYGLQIASQNIDRSSFYAPESVRSLTHSADGQELAPEKRVCEPPEDCSTCDKRDICEDYEEDEEEEDD